MDGERNCKVGNEIKVLGANEGAYTATRTVPATLECGITRENKEFAEAGASWCRWTRKDKIQPGMNPPAALSYGSG